MSEFGGVMYRWKEQFLNWVVPARRAAKEEEKAFQDSMWYKSPGKIAQEKYRASVKAELDSLEPLGESEAWKVRAQFTLGDDLARARVENEAKTVKRK